MFMRFDSIGLWWEDIPSTGRGGNIQRPMPEIPDTGWKAPTYYPNLESATALAIDTETYDPELEDYGPGWARGKGHIVGVSVAAYFPDHSTAKWYFPIRHETQPEDNLDPETTLSWLRDTLGNKKQPKIGANLPYDLGWLTHEGVEVKGQLIDVQFAEALLNENAKVALEILSQKYLGEGKESNLLYIWLDNWFGGGPTPKQRKWIYKAPPCLVGPYAESDAILPLQIAALQYPLLQKENLSQLFDIECRLIPLMQEMRFQGVQVDINKAEEIRDTLYVKKRVSEEKLKHLIGFEVNVNANDSLAQAFDSIGLGYGKTVKGKPSFTKPFLAQLDHPVGDLIRQIRLYEKLAGTFVESYILNSHINGKVYCQFHQLRGDSGGTRSGRYSSSTPNLQNIPARDEELAPLIRGMFIPDFGHPFWRKYDYSQVEYRMLIHFAIGIAGDIIRAYFNQHPDTDYHVYAQEMVQKATGRFIERKPIKNINFGLIYGMGVAKLAKDLGLSKKEATALMDSYFLGVPFAKPTMDAAMEEAQKLGVITTVLGRKSRFDLWEPAKWGDEAIGLPYNQALYRYGGNIRRAYTHKALNRKLQGSAADLMKVAMLRCYEDGVFAETGVPRLTVHDELDFSDPGGKDVAFNEMRRIMETALPQLKVPIKADGEIGPDWGHVTPI